MPLLILMFTALFRLAGKKLPKKVVSPSVAMDVSTPFVKPPDFALDTAVDLPSEALKGVKVCAASVDVINNTETKHSLISR